MLKPIFVSEGFRIFKRALRVKSIGTKKYSGNAKQICRQIVKDCWNQSYFQVSNGHFTEFYTRDFGLCTESLINLGYRKEVEKTLNYVLDIFKKNDKITTTINPDKRSFDFPYYASDSIPFLTHSLTKLNSKKLISKYSDFLNNQIKKYYDIILDKETGLVTKKRYFSSIKDYAKRKSSCYDNIMVAFLENNIRKLNLKNPFRDYNLKKTIKDNFWTGTHFIDDLSGYDFITGDANVFPYWTGIFTSKKMIKSSIDTIRKNGLDKPFPLRYYHKNIKEHDMISVEVFAKDYEKDTIWMHLGQAYLDVVKNVDKKLLERYLEQYEKLIEKNKNYLELFNSNGTPYKTFFYYADEGMLWSSMFLNLVR